MEGGGGEGAGGGGGGAMTGPYPKDRKPQEYSSYGASRQAGRRKASREASEIYGRNRRNVYITLAAVAGTAADCCCCCYRK